MCVIVRSTNPRRDETASASGSVVGRVDAKERRVLRVELGSLAAVAHRNGLATPERRVSGRSPLGE